MGQKSSKVVVKNQLDRRARVRVDCSRSYTKCLSITGSGKLKTPAGSISASVSYLSVYDVFHIVDTSTSFTIVGSVANGNEIAFDLIEDGKNFAFLTVWTENNDGSWSIYCENHPIIKCSEVQIGANILTKQFRFGEKDDIGRPMLREDFAGRVVVYNRSSRNIWARVDADGIEKTKETVAQSVEATNGTISLSESNNASTEHKVYYRAKQGNGYTLVRNNGKSRDYTVFHMKISMLNIFYLSIDYETPGKLMNGKGN
ncbi:unnamed protein product, partial [Mesorhabditis belari]|uniref:Uncharacterized protein n=1 Tax=Mesorhabditis belari TaxID=2138241 RepID=A0AAF3ELA7_9BILA